MALVPLAGRRCAVWGVERPRALLIEPMDAEEMAWAERQAAYIRRRTDRPFLLCAFPVEDWYGELSPWPAPALSGGRAFTGGGAESLGYLTGRLLPALRERYSPDVPALVGGYSLAGLFALWCAYESEQFAAAAAASPSVWFDGWLDYAAARRARTGAVYLSLGDREERAADVRLARVGESIRAQRQLLDRDGVAGTLVWEQGSHFHQAPERTARGFLWALEQIG